MGKWRHEGCAGTMNDLSKTTLHGLLGLPCGRHGRTPASWRRPERKQPDGESRGISVLPRLRLATGAEFGEVIFRN